MNLWHVEEPTYEKGSGRKVQVKTKKRVAFFIEMKVFFNRKRKLCI